MAYPSRPVSYGVPTSDILDTNFRFSNSTSPSALYIFGIVLLGVGCLFSACSLLAAGGFAIQGSEADATGVLLATVFMISNTVASNAFLLVSVASQVKTTVALGEPYALSVTSICGQALVFLGLGTTRIFSTNSVLVTVKVISTIDLSSAVLVYLAFWWPFMDYFAIAAGQLFIALIIYRLRLNSRLARREEGLGNGGVSNEEQTPLLLSG